MTWLFLFISFLLLYHYLLYPVLLAGMAYLCPKSHQIDESFEPDVALIISARNEEQVIRQKLENALSLDYPGGKLAIWVVSDGSTDNTDSIVEEFAARGVKLLRPQARRGKTAGLNEVMTFITADIVVFSDANAIYDALAIRKLVRHFHDPLVGYVVGYARYVGTEDNEAGFTEGTYWNFEILLKSWASSCCSVVGGDGAIYAIRRDLYEPLLDTDINDFVNPLQIVAKGYRGLFDPEAFCTERPAGEFQREFKRKVRITNRSFSGLLRVPEVCNPFRTGLFSWQVISHKLLRWFSPYLFLLYFLSSLLLPLSGGWTWVGHSVVLAYAVCALGGLAGLILRRRHGRSGRILALCYYFLIVHLACAIGVAKRLRGETISVWETPREGDACTSSTDGCHEDQMLVPILLLLIFLAGCRVLLGGFDVVPFSVIVAIILMGLLGYTYVGYPFVLRLISGYFRKNVQKDSRFTPEVTFLIAAYNEESVIEEKILNSLQQDYPAGLLKIVIASDGSTDRTNAIVEKYAAQGVTLWAYPQNRGKISVLNDSMARISSPVVVLSDANVMYDPLAIRILAASFADFRVGAVSGKVILLNEKLSYGKAEEQYYRIEHCIQEHEGLTGALVGADGAMYAIRRELFEPLPANTILDDFVISMNIARQGRWVLHESRALGFERNQQEISGEFRRKARIIAGGFQCLRYGLGMPRLSDFLLLFKFVSHKFLRWISGLLLLVLFVDLIYLYLWFPEPHLLLSILLWTLLASIVLAVAAQRFPTLRQIGIVSFLHYFYMLILASIVGFTRGLFGWQKVTWRSS